MHQDKFVRIFSKFLVNMERVNEPRSEEFQTILGDICTALRIEKIESFYYETIRDESMNNGVAMVLYDSGASADKAVLLKRHTTTRGTVLVLKFYMNYESESWDEEETDKANVFETMLYTFLGRAKLSQFAEYAMFNDREIGVPNMIYLNREIAKLRAMGVLGVYASGFFNLKRFSVVNQAVGRTEGTQIMIKYLGILREKLGPDGIVCRAGGDNFFVLFKKYRIDDVIAHMEGIEIQSEANMSLSLLVKANMGVYLVESDNDTNERVIESSHIALYQARNNIEKYVVYFDEGLQLASENANAIESMFREAIDNEEFLVYYQSKVNILTNKVAGAEALCRWKHNGKMIPPNDFIPVLEQSYSICTLDFYILEHVCRDIRRWIDSNMEPVKVSVNLSRRHLSDPKLLEKLLTIIDKYSVPHNLIEIELTETTTDVGFFDLQNIVNGLHENNILTSVDDFGVGYSSLNLIRQVPWDVIKIDKSFLPDNDDRTSSQYVLFSHILTMFRDMGLECLVEGVETIEQVQMLIENNCYLAQGYFFDQPLPVADFESRISVK